MLGRQAGKLLEHALAIAGVSLPPFALFTEAVAGIAMVSFSLILLFPSKPKSLETDAKNSI